MPARNVVMVADATERDAQRKFAGAGRKSAPIVFRHDTGNFEVYDFINAAWVVIPGSTPVAGVAAGYKIARGENQQATASDTVVTGLATVVACVAVPRTRTVKQLFFDSSIGDQAGTPAAGSILITSKKPTAVNDVTPIAATDFTDNIKVNWIAIGT